MLPITKLNSAKHTITTTATKGQRLKVVIQLFMGSPCQSNQASPAIWDHTDLLATRHRWKHHAL